jgi:hypothetical protein
MKISLAVTVCNELNEIQKLLPFLIDNKRKEDEIVILYDSKNGSKPVEDYLRANSVETYTNFIWHPYKFDGHFADMKNHLTNLCNGDYIYQIDADEMVSKYVLDFLPEVLLYNNIDVLQVPRINTIEGLTQEHIQKWGWRVNENGWVNFPDFQYRIYKNNGEIKWKNKVHEVLEGYKTITQLPLEEPWCLKHPKTIERQEKQNSLYETL